MKIPLLVFVCAASLQAAGRVEITDPKDQVILQAFLGHTKKETASLTREHFASNRVPENLCWLDFPKMEMNLTAYQLTGDAQYLRDFAGAMENLRSTVVKGPDGFLGWYGEPHEMNKDPARPDVVVSEIQTDFRAAGVLARFAELVKADPALKAELGAQSDAYLDLAENHLVKKWDGSFVDLGDRGAVYRWHTAYKPLVAAMSLPQEKAACLIEGLLGMFRATGDRLYAEKAAKLGLWFKRCLEFDGTRYAWNRWNPAADWDVSQDNPAKWRSWIAKEPKAIWHAASVGSAVALYEHGLVFDRTDMERFRKTQVEVSWNGDLQNPRFFTVDGIPAAEGERFLAPSLTPFAPEFARLVYEGPLQDLRVEKSGGAWQGGVIAAEWLLGKYVRLPAGDKPRHAKLGEAFLREADPGLVRQLSFSPVPPGCRTPPVPTEAVLAAMTVQP